MSIDSKETTKIYRVGKAIRKGGFRYTYECVDDPSVLLKIEQTKEFRHKRAKGPLKAVLQKVRVALNLHSKHIRGNHDELLGWQEIEALGLADHRAFTKVRGMVETDLGPALMVDKVTNFWSEDLRSVKDYIKARGSLDEPDLQDALEEYFEVLRSYCVSSFADRPENMGIVVDENGKRYIKCFDVKAYYDRHLIPIYKIPFLKRLRIQKRLRLHLGMISGRIPDPNHRLV